MARVEERCDRSLSLLLVTKRLPVVMASAASIGRIFSWPVRGYAKDGLHR
jgi:hypothetical protein